MAKKPIKITEVALRDAHQSLIATRMTMDEMRPILPAMDEVGYYSVECWGGATFDACLRFLDEDPWDRLRTLRKHMPNTPLQMLFRGQNMLGYRHYADDAVEYFVQKSVANGIDVLRIFDALNDPAQPGDGSIKAAHQGKGRACAGLAISATRTSPVHNNEYFAQVRQAPSRRCRRAHAICLKDMAGLLAPYSHLRAGQGPEGDSFTIPDPHPHPLHRRPRGSMTILKAIEAGADVIDTALSARWRMGTTHPPTESHGGRASRAPSTTRALT